MSAGFIENSEGNVMVPNSTRMSVRRVVSAYNPRRTEQSGRAGHGSTPLSVYVRALCCT